MGEGDSGNTGGRRPVMLTLNSTGRYVIGIDLGTTNTNVGLANLKGELIEKICVPTNRNHSVKPIVSQISNLIEEIIKKAKIERDLVEGGEVSKVNDDNQDNCFLEDAGRFPDIDEDEDPLYLLCNEYPQS